jgi:hypothetical protein
VAVDLTAFCNSNYLPTCLELPGTKAAFYTACGPDYSLYYFEQGCTTCAALPQVTLTASLTRKLNYSKNSTQVVLTHHPFHEADGPRNISSIITFSEGCLAILGQHITRSECNSCLSLPQLNSCSPAIQTSKQCHGHISYCGYCPENLVPVGFEARTPCAVATAAGPRFLCRKINHLLQDLNLGSQNSLV